jgi:hypothetical protein
MQVVNGSQLVSVDYSGKLIIWGLGKDDDKIREKDLKKLGISDPLASAVLNAREMAVMGNDGE